MKISTVNYNNPKQGYLPLFLSDCLDLLDPVLTFDRLMGVIDLNKYLTDIPEYTTGRLRYNPFNMLKTVLFGFMTSGYCSLREPEDNCKVNIRFMYLMDHHTPVSYTHLCLQAAPLLWHPKHRTPLLFSRSPKSRYA